MATFSFTWDATFLSQPADNESINLGASRIRSFKDGVTERLAIDHSWAGDANDGKHNQVTLRPAPGPHVIDADDGRLINVVDGGVSELAWVNDVGQIAQITQLGGLLPAFASNLSVGGTLTVGNIITISQTRFANDGNFYAQKDGSGFPVINFAANSYIQFNTTTGKFNFVSNGVLVGSFPP
jgi:hypothetical protein